MALCCACTLDAKIVALEGGDDGSFDADTSVDDGGETFGETGTSGSPPRFDVPVDGEPGELEDAGIPRSCAEASAYPSSMGCVFYGLDLDQPSLFDPIPHGVVLINVSHDMPAHAIVEHHAPAGWTPVDAVNLSPQTHQLVELPDDTLAGTGLFERGSYRIVSDRPIAAIALSAWDPAETWSTSSMSLMPQESWTSETTTPGWRSEDDIGEYGYVSLVAGVDATSVEVHASAPAIPGGGITIDDPEFPIVVGLDAGDVVQVAADTIPYKNMDRGLAGTRVVAGSEHRVAVFASHACAAIPEYEGSCGHFAGQILSQLAGEHFVVAGQAAVDPLFPTPTLWQLIAVEDAEISFRARPGTSGVPELPVFLEQGEVYDLWVHGPGQDRGAFEVEADGSVALVRLTTVQPAGHPGGPSLVQMVPTDKGLTEQWIYAPDGFDSQQLLISRAPGVEVRIDGLALAAEDFAPVDGAIGSWELGHLFIEPGLHHVSADEAISVVVAGDRAQDSYAHIGGWGTPVPEHPPEG